MWIDNGQVRESGSTANVVSAYEVVGSARLREERVQVRFTSGNELSAARGMPTAVANRKVAAEKMTAAQLAQAQKLVREWKPTAVP